MKLNRIPTIAITVIALALALPIAALADVTGTPTLAANTALSFDTGTTSTSGGDILWSGTSMTPQGSAGAYNLGNLGLATYSTLPLSTFSALPSSFFTKSAIAIGSLPVGEVLAVNQHRRGILPGAPGFGQQPVEMEKERGFSGAVGADESHGVVLGDGE